MCRVVLWWIGPLIVLACAILARPQFTTTMAAQASPRRLALVIGNDEYPAARLSNSKNDARAVAGTLTRVGFRVTTVFDANQDKLATALASFSSSLGPGDVALFYFAGHGVQIDNQNYLLPVDFSGAGPQLVTLKGISALSVEKQLRAARIGIVIVDACRSNPYSGTRQFGSSLTATTAVGTLVVLSAAAGESAEDSPQHPNGVFVTELLKELEIPNVDVGAMFRRVRERVYRTTQGRQRPQVLDDRFGEFVLVDRPSAVISGPALATRLPATPPPEAAAKPMIALTELQRQLLRQTSEITVDNVAHQRYGGVGSTKPTRPNDGGYYAVMRAEVTNGCQLSIRDDSTGFMGTLTTVIDLRRASRAKSYPPAVAGAAPELTISAGPNCRLNRNLDWEGDDCLSEFGTFNLLRRSPQPTGHVSFNIYSEVRAQALADTLTQMINACRP
jgi:Caspase domain